MVVGLDTICSPTDVEGLALGNHLDKLVGLVTYRVKGPSGQIVNLDTIDRVREHEPNLPGRGSEGIPIRDRWEFEKMGPLGVPVP
ncbi:MAG TPA: hypothetical protein VLT32_12050 [Candidatus Sulfomarinibacteraceae bacterium]|nr:hypothetical protein [Candidatus Sulfomarinibacteraceae bacterium]